VTGRSPATAQATPYDGNSVARSLYTNARFELSTRTAGGLAAAERDFRRLVELEPRQAAGWSGLADTYLLLRQYGALNDAATYPRAAEAASKAIALDPDSADAWLDHAFIAFWWRADSGTAFHAFDRALKLAPNSPKAYHWYGTALLTHGEFAKSLEMMAKARALDPDNRSIVADEGWMRFIAGQRTDGLATLEHLAQVDPSFVSTHSYLARAYLTLGRDAEFLREARAAAHLRGQTETLARLDIAQQQFEAGGRVALLDALTASEAEDVARGTGSGVIVARYRALALDEEGMYHWIGVAETQHDHLLTSLRVDPELAAYRLQPRYQELIKRLP
jgi:tetratricopeptide (TPR) repeat protein